MTILDRVYLYSLGMFLLEVHGVSRWVAIPMSVGFLFFSLVQADQLGRTPHE